MTNEEIIRTATESFYRDYLPKQPLPEAIGELTFKVMELKTLQVKELLEKKKVELIDRYSGLKDIPIVNEIINELFYKE